MIDRILSISRKSFSEIVKLRCELHQYPELAFEEFETGKIIGRDLEKLNMPAKNSIGKTGLIGTLKGEPRTKKQELRTSSKVVALRADMDALPITEKSGVSSMSNNPGKMHACGHDVHVAMLIGAAKILSEMKAEVNGTVKFLFQQSEEKIQAAHRL